MLPVLSSCVIGLPDEDYGNVVHAIVELTPGAAVTDEELTAHLAARLVSYKCPSEVRVVEQLPITAAHKLDHVALRRVARGEQDLSTG